MVKTIKSSMSQARKKMLEQIKNKEESEVKRKKTAKEKYKDKIPTILYVAMLEYSVHKDD